MSLELLMIPIGIAAWRAIKEYRRTDLCESCVQSRVTSGVLLERTLRSMGFVDLVVDGASLTAKRDSTEIRFLLLEEVYLGRIDGATEEENEAFIQEVDSAAGQLLQSEKIDQMRTRAAQLGLRLVGEEIADDGTVQMLFEEIES
jgi:hypothetical protein